jgi:hypothetical protein
MALRAPLILNKEVLLQKIKYQAQIQYHLNVVIETPIAKEGEEKCRVNG